MFQSDNPTPGILHEQLRSLICFDRNLAPTRAAGLHTLPNDLSEFGHHVAFVRFKSVAPAQQPFLYLVARLCRGRSRNRRMARTCSGWPGWPGLAGSVKIRIVVGRLERLHPEHRVG